MKNIIVTGGAGFIGSNFILFMLKKYSDIKIINLDKLTYAGNLDNLKSVENDERYIFIKGDICNKRLIKEIFKKYTIDYIVHFAAESHVDRSINNPEVFVKTNVLGTVTVLNAAKEVWEKDGRWKEGVKFVHISTDEVYGSLGDIGYFTEDTNLDPHSPYSASKASADLIVKSYYDTYKMPVNITRCSNNYGPFQFPEKLIPLIINNCIEKEELPIYGDGLNVRDWIYVEDHVRAIDMVINSGRIGEVYNIGGRNERTNIDIVKSIIDYFKKNVDYTIDESLIKFIEDRKGHDRRYGIDSTKINEELGWYPKMDFYVGMKKTIQWYLNNQDWINNIKLGEYKKYYNKMYK